MCGRSILNLLHRSSCKKGLEKSSKQCRHLLTKIPSCSIFWSIVSLALHTASVPMILCFLIPSSIFLNQGWPGGLKFHPARRRRNRRSPDQGSGFQTEALQCFCPRGIQSRIFDSRSICEEKCRHAENDGGCDCESGARASHAAYLRGTTLQARC